MANFGNGQRKQWVAIRGHFKDHRGDQILGTDSGQKCMSEHAQRDVSVIRNRSAAHYSRITAIIPNITLVPYTITDLSSVYSE